MRKFNLTEYAKHDPSHCLAPNLFRSLKRGDRKKLKLDITYQYSETESVRFVGFEPLDPGDMKILQAVVALSGKSEKLLALSNPKTELGQNLAKLLDPKDDAIFEKSRVAETTLYELLGEIGLAAGGRQREVAMASLLRLSNVTVSARNKNRQWSCQMMGYSFNKDTNRLTVALNPRITDAILGQRGTTYVNMHEVRIIKSDPASILHQRLSAVVNAGKVRMLKLETMMGYVWAADCEISAVAIQKRRLVIKKCMVEIAKTGNWKFEDMGDCLFKVSRKKYINKLNVNIDVITVTH